MKRKLQLDDRGQNADRDDHDGPKPDGKSLTHQFEIILGGEPLEFLFGGKQVHLALQLLEVALQLLEVALQLLEVALQLLEVALQLLEVALQLLEVALQLLEVILGGHLGQQVVSEKVGLRLSLRVRLDQRNANFLQALGKRQGIECNYGHGHNHSRAEANRQPSRLEREPPQFDLTERR